MDASEQIQLKHLQPPALQRYCLDLPGKFGFSGVQLSFVQIRDDPDGREVDDSEQLCCLIHIQAGVRETFRSTIKIGEKTTTGRGGRYFTEQALELAVAQDTMRIVEDRRPDKAELKKLFPFFG